MKSILQHKYEDIISVENLLQAWQEFLKRKRNKPDVQEFQFRLMDNIFDLHYSLKNKTYQHGGYTTQCTGFYIHILIISLLQTLSLAETAKALIGH